MPRKSGKKLALRRKRFVKRRNYKALSAVGKTLNPISQRYICKMKYAETINTDAAGVIKMNLNSIFDPNRSGIGHQPYGFDTFATMYNRYRVISCAYRIIANRNNDTLQIIAQPGNELVTYSTASEHKENPRCRYKTQAPNGEVQHVAGVVSIPSLVGRSKAQYMADDRYQALMTADPVEAAILNIGVYNGSDAPLLNVPVNIELVYLVELFDVKHLPQS